MNYGNGAVSVSVTPRQSLCDGKFHVVTGMIPHADSITQTRVDLMCCILMSPSSSVQTA